MKKTILYATATMVPVLAVLGFPRMASAAEAESSSSAGLRVDEIVVMARRVSEPLQKVPVAVTAFSGADLQRLGIKSYTDFALATPSVHMQNHTIADTFGTLINLRGVENPSSQLAVSLPIATYIDGVFTNSLIGIGAKSLYDVERVEVLKGPQGTLFGQNTTAGAVAIYTKRPTNEFQGELGVGFGNYGLLDAKSMINIPIAKDRVALRVVGEWRKDDGYGFDTGNNRPLGDIDLWNLRGTLKFNPSENLEILLEGHGAEGHANGVINRTTYIQPGSLTNRALATYLYGPTALAPANIGTTLPAALAAFEAQKVADGRFNRLIWPSPSATDPFGPAHNDIKDEGASLSVDYDLHFAHLKSITGYDSWKKTTVNHFGTIAPMITFPADAAGEQISQELQLLGDAFDQRFKYTVGAYYFHFSGFDEFRPLALGNVNGQLNQTPQIKQNDYAVYGQGTYALTSNLNLTGGLRWTWSQRIIAATAITPLGCQIQPLYRNNGACEVLMSTFENSPSWTAGADWTFAPSKMIYAKASKGYTSGGPQPRVTGDPNTYRNYDAETVLQYEVGAKMEFFDHRLRTNLAAYWSDYSNIQRVVQLPVPIPGGGTTFTALLTNAAKATIKGVEAEITAVPFEHANLSLSGSYTEPKYNSFIDRGFDVSFQRFQSVSRWQYTVSGGYELPTQIGPLQGELTWAWRSAYDMSPLASPGTVLGAGRGPGIPDAYRIQQGFGLLNASVRLTVDRFDADFRFYATNLLDKDYLSGGAGVPALGLNYFVVGEPRRWGFEVLKRF